MGAKDLVYLGLIALSAVIFYLHGLRRARQSTRRKLDVAFNDSGCLTELSEDEKPKQQGLARVPSLSPKEIRAVFGDN